MKELLSIFWNRLALIVVITSLTFVVLALVVGFLKWIGLWSVEGVAVVGVALLVSMSVRHIARQLADAPKHDESAREAFWRIWS